MSIYDTSLLDYISFRQSTYLNYRRAGIDPQKYKILLPQAMKFVQCDLPTSVLSTSDDPKSVLEHGIRQWTGYGAPKDRPAAIEKWRDIASRREDVPVSLKARAYSSLTRGWFDLSVQGRPLNPNIDHLYEAGNCANEAVGLGLISPAVLAVASKAEGLGQPGNNILPGQNTERFESLTDLWEALDARKAEMAEKDSKREAKVSKDPLGYFCAAEDCGIVATKKSTLWRCGGGCPPVFKPSYCSKYCQKADRKHHRPYCTPDATESSVRPVDTLGAATTVRRREDPPEDETSEDFELGPERSINANMGGRILQISSNTIGPQMMREMRDAIETKVSQRRQDS